MTVDQLVGKLRRINNSTSRDAASVIAAQAEELDKLEKEMTKLKTLLSRVQETNRTLVAKLRERN